MMKIVAGNSNRPLAEAICSYLHLPPVKAVVKRFNDMEVFVGRAVPQEGTTIRMKGDRGRLVVPQWFVDGQGLKHL